MHAELKQALLYCPNLPSLSGVAVRLVEIGRDPEAGISEIADVLSQDIALASKIIRVANSPLYAQRRRIDNLRQAVLFLGLNGIMTLGLSFSLVASLHQSGAAGDHLSRLWRRSLLAALASRLLGEELGLRSLEELFLAGLLQDLGILALDTAVPKRYRPLAAEAGSHDELIEREKAVFGCDHSVAGAWLMEQWNLPEYLRMAARCSHGLEPATPPDLRAFMACIAVSGPIADIYLLGDTEAATDRAGRSARHWMGLSRARLKKVLSRLSQTLPEVEALFAIRLGAPEAIAGITDQAQELLAVHSLKLSEHSAEQVDRVQRLEEERDWLQEAARRDSLTGLYNRRFLETALLEEFEHAGALGSPLTVGFLDLDRFKSINDAHGHQAGDAALRAVAQTLDQQLRQGDHIVRYGGEEFVVLLPGTGREPAQLVFERIRAAIAAARYPLESGETLQLTVSVGVATYVPREQSMASAEELLRAADEALYAAKREGRDRVEVAG